MNKITIIGALGKAPELRTTQAGKSVCTFSVAVDEKHGGTEKTTWFRVTAWGKLAELCQKYLDKGRKVCVIGSVGMSEYTGKDGKQHFNLEITADEVEFLGGKQDSTQTQDKTIGELSGFIQVDPSDELPF